MYASNSFQVSIRGVCAHDSGLFLLSTGALCPLRGRASSGGEDGGVGAGRRDGYRGNERFLFGIWCYLRDMRRHWGEPRFSVLLQGLAVKCVCVLFGASLWKRKEKKRRILQCFAPRRFKERGKSNNNKCMNSYCSSVNMTQMTDFILTLNLVICLKHRFIFFNW